MKDSMIHKKSLGQISEKQAFFFGGGGGGWVVVIV